MGHRNVRVSDALWSAALKKAADERTTVAAVINDALRAYTGVKPPGGPSAAQRNAAASVTAAAAETRRAAVGTVGTAERRAAAREGKPLDRLGEACPHPRARVLRGLCMACGEAVTPAKAV